MQRLLFRTIFSIIFIITAMQVCAAPNGAIPLDRVIAIVNDQVITESQLNAMVSDMKSAMQASNTPVPGNLKQQALDQLINQQLQMQVAIRNKITVDNAEVDKVLVQIAEQNHLTPDQFKQALAKQNVNYAKFRTQIHDQLIVHKLQQGLFGARVTVNDAEVQAYLKKAPSRSDPNTQYHVEDLLIPLPESPSSNDTSAAQKQAQDLLAKARQGSSFQQLAAATPSLQQSDLGWRRIADLPDIFSTQVANLKPGNISSPINAPNGIHLLKLLEIQGAAKQMTAAEAKNMVFQEKVKAQIDEWMEKLRKTAYIKTM